ncbi:MAG: anthranilate phosphoribosyltransferase [Flavobacteriia bacterium]|nr:anthranilate phosphoribosyltransferase [Flavobacteriia bacterium]
MKKRIQKILNNQSLTTIEASEIIYAIAEGLMNDAQVVALMIGLEMKGLSLDEIEGFRLALLNLSMKIELDSSMAIDLCGTGGDGKNTFNISTTTSFVLAAMGQKVIKHGNYGASSSCGSSNVLEALGYEFTNNERILNEQLKSKNICFLHAPLFHPTLKKVGHLRKDLGIRTFFNSLGPLVNPVQPAFQLSGTYDLELAKIYQHILKKNRTNYRVVFGMDGFDEITLTEQTRVLGKSCDEVLDATIFGLQKVHVEQIKAGKNVSESAAIVKSILKGKGSEAQLNVVAVNTAIALECFYPNTSKYDLFIESLSFIKSGQTAKTFKF